MTPRRPKLKTKWKKNLTEEILAQYVVDWLEARNWDVYHEVQLYARMDVVDLAAVKDGIYWMIEVKKAFGFKVLQQAMNWKQFSHKISVAVPSKEFLGVEYATLKHLGIGLFIIGPDKLGIYEDGLLVQEDFQAEYREGPIRLPELLPEHKELARAGSPGGGHVTPFRMTRMRLVEHVNENPGKDIKEVLGDITHHYGSVRSARQSIMDLISRGIIHELVMVREDGKVLLYPVKED